MLDTLVIITMRINGFPGSLRIASAAILRQSTAIICLILALTLSHGCSEPDIIRIPQVPTPSSAKRSYTSPQRLNLPLPEVELPGFIDAPPGEGIERYLNQAVSWSECVHNGASGQCTNLAVPLDYAAPNTQAITVALFKRPAIAKSAGTLFINPGGPGESGRNYAAWSGWSVLPEFDIVGWDPRGTGASTPIDCGDTEAIDRLLELNAIPDKPEATATLLDSWKQFGLSCLQHSGALLAHISTQDTVDDLEILRSLIGDDHLNYLGYSYGTLIGALYAETYPDKVGRMVLDSPVNLTDDDSISQEVGFSQAFDSYLNWCANNTECELGNDSATVQSRIIALLDQLGSTPIPTENRLLTQHLATFGIMGYLYFDESAWPHLTNAIVEAEAGTGTNLLVSSDQVWGRDSLGEYHTFAPFQAISCLDNYDGGLAGAEADWVQEKVRSGVLGLYLGINVACVQWPVPPLDLPTITAKGAAPIVVVGATGDSATPYTYAPWMADQLESGVLVTYDGAGHGTSFSQRSSCVDEAVKKYLTGKRVPPNGLFCS